MSAGEGRRVWIFPDGDLPPAGEDDLPLEGHESMIVLNTGDADAHIEMDAVSYTHLTLPTNREV